MTLELILKSDTFLEVATGKVTKGKETQVFGEYFPAINPVLKEYGIQPLSSFAIFATNTPGVAPEMGSLTHCPSAENFKRFYNDPRFTKLKPLRDDALDLLSDGNFFRSLDKVVNLNTDAEYALIIADGNPLKTDPVLDIPLAKDSPKQIYSGKSMTLHPWSDEAELLMSTSSAEAVVFQIRFNPSDS